MAPRDRPIRATNDPEASVRIEEHNGVTAKTQRRIERERLVELDDQLLASATPIDACSFVFAGIERFGRKPRGEPTELDRRLVSMPEDLRAEAASAAAELFEPVGATTDDEAITDNDVHTDNLVLGHMRTAAAMHLLHITPHHFKDKLVIATSWLDVNAASLALNQAVYKERCRRRRRVQSELERVDVEDSIPYPLRGEFNARPRLTAEVEEQIQRLDVEKSILRPLRNELGKARSRLTAEAQLIASGAVLEEALLQRAIPQIRGRMIAAIYLLDKEKTRKYFIRALSLFAPLLHPSTDGGVKQ
jgi:hypothetical protein